MVEIDDMWIKANNNFARSQEEMAAFAKAFDTSKAARIISVQAWTADFVAKFPHTVLFLGNYVKKFWARVAPPQAYYWQRFFTSHLAPSLGTIETQEALILKLQTFVATSSDRETAEEGSQIITLLKMVIDLNAQVDECKAKMQQFIAG